MIGCYCGMYRRVGVHADGCPALEAYEDCDSDASLAEDAKRLSPEGVAARAEGIAQDMPHD